MHQLVHNIELFTMNHLQLTAGMLILLRLNLQVTLGAQRGITTFTNVRFGIIHETYRTLSISLGITTVRALETCGELSIGNETADLLGVPFACWVEPGFCYDTGQKQ